MVFSGFLSQNNKRIPWPPPTPISTYSNIHAVYNYKSDHNITNPVLKVRDISFLSDGIRFISFDGRSNIKLATGTFDDGPFITSNITYTTFSNTFTRPTTSELRQIVSCDDSNHPDYGKVFYLFARDSDILKVILPIPWEDRLPDTEVFEVTTTPLPPNVKTNISCSVFYDNGNKLGFFDTRNVADGGNKFGVLNLSSPFQITSNEQLLSPDVVHNLYEFDAEYATLGNIKDVSWVSRGNYCYVYFNSKTVILYDTRSGPYDIKKCVPENRLDKNNIIFNNADPEGNATVALKFDPRPFQIQRQNLGVYFHALNEANKDEIVFNTVQI